jgi:hypothetical protein
LGRGWRPRPDGCRLGGQRRAPLGLKKVPEDRKKMLDKQPDRC